MSEVSLQPCYLRTPQAACYLSLSPRTLEKLRVVGGGPEYSKIGRVVLYAIAELDVWLSEHRRRSTSQSGIKS
jgi:hypothetical protein